MRDGSIGTVVILYGEPLKTCGPLEWTLNFKLVGLGGGILQYCVC